MKHSLPTIETERLQLVELGPESYNALFTQLSDEELMTFFGYLSKEKLEEGRARYQQGMTGYQRSFVKFVIRLKEDGRAIGSCSYHTWMTFHQRAEIGYYLHSDADKGKGYMKEAVTAIIKHGFEKMNLHRIEALVGPGNEPSLRMLKHFGFTQEGHLREHYMKNGVLEDSVVFSLLRGEYK